MVKRILYLGYNFSPELTGIGKYSGEMMEWLAKRGHQCTVITGYPYYPQWQIQEPYRSKRFWFTKEKKRYDDGGSLTIYRCPMYVPENPTGRKRIISDFTFFISALLLLNVFFFKKRYEFVISVSPTFLSGLLGVLYKTVKKAKHLHHIQDLQIEAALELGLIKSKKLVSFLLSIENYIFRHSDVISSISDAMIKRIAEKANREVIFLPNWVDTSFFYPLEDRNSIKPKFGFDIDDKLILYSGGIGAKQGLENILFAAEALKNKRNVKFIVCGSGPYKEILREKAEKMALHNLSFFPLQPKENFNLFLNMADVHLVIQKKNASDLVMPSKLTTILAVGGIALITANQGTELFDVVSKYGMGHLVEAEDQNELINGITGLIEGNSLSEIQENAYDYAKEFLNVDRIMEHLDSKVLV
ncbi:WcaI family glycosyltransferase [Pareuzebyella sediminis]|uniref:WcaI family glycosyltransferase n=1 Tax=Pareuzebyella sediminis TaxID=2607998 RepID=UPI0011EE2129|nr:WcaI family glycosyltransferase [Pareuzebyella sediminis]